MFYKTPLSGYKDIEATGESPIAHSLLDKPSLKSTTQSESMSLDAADYIRPASSRQTLFLVGTSILLALVAFVELCIALPLLWNTEVSLPGFERYPRFLVIGDWGREGCCNQTVVAESMARKARTFHPDFIVSTGDNFYEYGLVSPDDLQFDTSFTQIYNQSELAGIPWHAALGNHDYGETDKPKLMPRECSTVAIDNDECFYGPAHQLDVRLSLRDARWHCERFYSIKLAGGDVEIFFIDTTPIIRSYGDEVWADNRGGVAQQSPEDQMRELEVRLASSSARWKFVVGHHPIRTNHRSDHKFADMVDAVEPILVRYGVQAYFAGHDHNLQHLHDPETGYHHITSGAGSSIGTGFYGTKHSPFQWAGNGFVAVEMGRSSTKVEYIGVEGNADPLFSIVIPRENNNI